ncbi:MAG TPA: F0F1 ATP synthase subunit gamma, partial [Polyangiaceae bacterium]
MPSLKAIRKRIASTKATQKITRAMKMVAGARLTRAQQRIVAMRPYAVKTGEVLHSVAKTMTASADASDDGLHPLLSRRPEQKALYLVLSADRGLCGALNTNIAKASERAWREKEAH